MRFLWMLGIIACLGCGAPEFNSQVAIVDLEDENEIEYGMGNTGDSQARMTPHRRLTKSQEWYASKELMAGIETGFNGASFAVQTKIKLTRNYRLAVWLFAPGEARALKREDGEVVTRSSSSRPFKYVCRFGAHYSIDPSLFGKISVYGNGMASQEGVKETTSVIQSSHFFEINDESTNWNTLFEQCRSYGEENHIQESIESDLSLMVDGMVYQDRESACVVDSHCSEWHDGLLPYVQRFTKPVCRPRPNGVRTCRLRGIHGAACRVYDRETKERLSAGVMEYKCAARHECRITQRGGWFRNGQVYSYWKANCFEE